MQKKPSSLKKYLLNRTGKFGKYGGRYLPELLVPVMEELETAFFEAKKDPEYLKELRDYYQDFLGRPTPLYHCKNLSGKLNGAQIYIKNEGLLHTGAHKINHAIGQVLLAKRMGKKRVIAETGAGQHGLATATVCAKMGLECTIYMGAKDYARQRPNVFWMERLGAKVVPVTTGGQILRDAINESLRDLLAHPEESHFLLGTVCGPHPYPVMNTFFQKIIGEEVRKQMKKKIGKLPDALYACVGGGSNAIGLFYDFLDEDTVQMIGVEAGGKGIKKKSGKFLHASRLQEPQVGVVEGFKSYFLQNKNGQIGETQSICAGLDYSGIGPQHAYLHDIGRVTYTYATDQEALKAYEMLAKYEGVFAALESSHALAASFREAPKLSKSKNIVVNVSGRGDKDLFITTKAFDEKAFGEFLHDYLSSK